MTRCTPRLGTWHRRSWLNTVWCWHLQLLLAAAFCTISHSLMDVMWCRQIQSLLTAACCSITSLHVMFTMIKYTWILLINYCTVHLVGLSLAYYTSNKVHTTNSYAYRNIVLHYSWICLNQPEIIILTMKSKKLCKCKQTLRHVTNIQKIALEKACNKRMTVKDTQGHLNSCY